MVRFRASGIGNCLPQIVTSVLDPDATKASEDRKVFLQIGHALQPVLDEFMEDNGFSITDGEMEVSYEDENDWVLTGHVDGVAKTPDGEKVLVEYKCITDKKWKQVKGCGDWRTVYPHYYAQIQAYMGLSKITKCVMVFMNRNTAEIIVGYDLPNSIYRPDCLVPFSPDTYVMLATRLDVAKSWVVGKEVPGRDLCDTIGFCYFCRQAGGGDPYADSSTVSEVDSDTVRLIKDRRSLRRQMFAVNKKLLEKFEFYNTEHFRVDVGVKSGKAILSKFDVIKDG